MDAVGLGNSPIQEIGKNGREFQIRAVEVKNIADENRLESHADLGAKIIDALRGTDGQSETAQGLKDLNSIDQKNLSPSSNPPSPKKGRPWPNKS